MQLETRRAQTSLQLELPVAGFDDLIVDGELLWNLDDITDDESEDTLTTEPATAEPNVTPMDCASATTPESSTPSQDYDVVLVAPFAIDNEDDVFFTPTGSPRPSSPLPPAALTATSPDHRISVAERLRVPVLSITSSDYLRYVRQVPLAWVLPFLPSQFQQLTESAREQFLATAFKDLRTARCIKWSLDTT